ncbi:MAG: hypothetical protein H6Q90_4709 [Deltaproteobacteria bacterium]|nr:hypothetical protein [Deltaproteobacteria bacterium]
MNTDPSRFDRVEAHPDYRTAPEQPVLPADASLGIAIAAPVSIALFGIVVLIVLGMLITLRPSLMVTVIFIAAIAVIAANGMRRFGAIIEFRNAPIERRVAVIVKDRTEVTGGTEHHAASTSYYTTLQLRDGTRIECRTYRSIVGRLAVGDIGVAYIKAQTLVEFFRFDVD